MTRHRLLIGMAAVAALLMIGRSAPGSTGQIVATVQGKAEGNGLFKSYCSSCHGALGKGDGPVAVSLKPPPSDLTQLSLRNKGTFPADDIRKIIDGRKRSKPHGTQMPAWGDAFSRTTQDTDEASVTRRIDALVAFIESIQVSDSKTP